MRLPPTPAETEGAGFPGDVDHYRARVLQDVLLLALPAYWDRRAAAFEAARPSRDDFHGRATGDDLAQADHRNAQTAQACRNRARVIRGEDGSGRIDPLAYAVLHESIAGGSPL